jgi:hypothetical protein
MKYSDFLIAAKRHEKTCKVIVEEINRVDDDFEKINPLVSNLYYLSGYILECSLKYKVLEYFGFKDEVVDKNNCESFGIPYHRGFKVHNFKILQELLDSKNSTFNYYSEDFEVSELLNNWKPDVRYNNIEMKYSNVKVFHDHVKEMLKLI